MPAESSYDAIKLRPDLSTSHEESENCYQALAAERDVGHGVSSGVSDDTDVFMLLLCHSQLRYPWNLRLGIATS